MPPAADEEEEDDYMSMVLPCNLSTTIKESSLQRRQRLRREAEERARPLSKAELEAKEIADREASLATSIDSSSKGARMLAKLGFKGGALGKGGNGVVEPIRVEVKEGRGGVGTEGEKKRKWREVAEAEAEKGEKRRLDEGEYRERMMVERETKRVEGQWWGAMKVAEGLDGGDGATVHGSDAVKSEEGPLSKQATPRPLASVPVEYRALIRQRRDKERERKMRFDLQQNISRLPTYDDPDEEKDEKLAFGREEEEVEVDDAELNDFIALEAVKRLEQVVRHMREKHHYCFWCKYAYEDERLEGCPGIREEDHD